MVEQYREWSGAGGLPLGDWEPVGHYEQGELVAVAMLRGSEIHFAVNPQWRRRLIQRARTRLFLAPLIERWGFLTTRTTNNVSLDFLKRLGFTETWVENGVQHLMLTGLPFSRGELSFQW